MITFNYIASFFLIALGFYTIITKYNLVKTVIGLGIADYGVNLLIISIGFNPGGTAMSLALVVKLHESYGTLDTREIRRLRG